MGRIRVSDRPQPNRQCDRRGNRRPEHETDEPGVREQHEGEAEPDSERSASEVQHGEQPRAELVSERHVRECVDEYQRSAEQCDEEQRAVLVGVESRARKRIREREQHQTDECRPAAHEEQHGRGERLTDRKRLGLEELPRIRRVAPEDQDRVQEPHGRCNEAPNAVLGRVEQACVDGDRDERRKSQRQVARPVDEHVASELPHATRARYARPHVALDSGGVGHRHGLQRRAVPGGGTAQHPRPVIPRPRARGRRRRLDRRERRRRAGDRRRSHGRDLGGPTRARRSPQPCAEGDARALRRVDGR